MKTLAILFALLCALCGNSSAAEKPNVILILSDDHGFTDYRFMGHKIVRTPIRFIEQHKGGPFYVNVWSHISHHQIKPPQSYVDRFKDVVVDESKFSALMREKFAMCKARGGDVSEHMRRHLADIYSMDEDIGRLLKRLDELGLRENTIVAFSSDQGPADIRGSAADDPDKRK